MDVIDNAPASRYELHVGEQVAFAQYKKQGDVIAFLHTEVPHELEGQGLAGRIAAKALADARDNHMKVVPRCPYFAKYIARHPEYADLVTQDTTPANA